MTSSIISQLEQRSDLPQDWLKLIKHGPHARLDHLLAASGGTTREEVAALCLQFGRPALALQWSREPLTQAAAQLRLGQASAARLTLAALPETARPAILRVRADWQQEQAADHQVQAAQHLARQEGDAGAMIAAATLAGEMLLPTPYAALRTLAEGLKVTEKLGLEADAYLLAVLAHAQLRAGGKSKALKTAAKALERSEQGSPARAAAYLVLNEPQQALAEANAGELSLIWLRPFQTAALRS